MKISISNIAWSKENDIEMLEFLSKKGFDAIEIAPTRIIENTPYECIEEAKTICEDIKQKYKLDISSMQSIWFGKTERIFESESNRKSLIDYSKKAIDFANAINCKNLVFGCPKNRIISSIEKDYSIAIDFFSEIGEYAYLNNTCFSIEPNPTIYNTNFINTTNEAIKFIRDVNCEGVKINIDLGTIIYNSEDISILENNINLINHVHFSEPNLEYLEKRKLHKDIIDLLKRNGYNKYVSIELKNQNNTEKVKEIAGYVYEIVKE